MVLKKYSLHSLRISSYLHGTEVLGHFSYLVNNITECNLIIVCNVPTFIHFKINFYSNAWISSIILDEGNCCYTVATFEDVSEREREHICVWMCVHAGIIWGRIMQKENRWRGKRRFHVKFRNPHQCDLK